MSTSVTVREKKNKEDLVRQIWGTGTPAEEREEERGQGNKRTIKNKKERTSQSCAKCSAITNLN